MKRLGLALFSFEAAALDQPADQASGDSVDRAGRAARMRDAFKEVDDDRVGGDGRDALVDGGQLHGGIAPLPVNWWGAYDLMTSVPGRPAGRCQDPRGCPRSRTAAGSSRASSARWEPRRR